jgi:chemotaxis protein methyltransferase CheR
MEIPPPSEQEFALFQRLIHNETGIFLAPAKRTLLISRLRKRICEVGCRSFGAYYRHLTRHDPAERVRMLERICTNETRFFREPWQFELLTRTVLPRLREQVRSDGRHRRLRAWSAGCSSGEEPYTLAMVLLQHLPPSEGWRIDILASDLSTRILERARAAVYPVDRSAEIPGPLFETFMRRGTGRHDGLMEVGPLARSVVQFECLNLCRDAYPAGAPFDLIFCRNVLIYFDAPTRASVVKRLLGRLDQRGLIFLGHAETLAGMGHGLRAVAPMAYTRPGAAETWS